MTTWWDPDTYLDAVVGALVPADYGDHIKDNLKALYAPPQVQVFQNTADSIPNATTTALSWTAGETYDTDAMHSTVTDPSRLTAARTGVHHLSGYAVFSGSAGGSQRTLLIRRNGTTTLAQIDVPRNGSSATALSISTDYRLVVGDYVELCVFHDAGGALAMANSILRTFSARWAGLV